MAEGIQLHKAVALYDIDKVSSLLDVEGFEVAARDGSGQTALHFAIRRNLQPVIHLLLDKRFPVNIQDNGGYTPLHLAVLTRSKKLVRKLLNVGAETEHKNEHGLTALHIAALIIDWGMFESLLRAGAESGSEDGRGRTPLQILIRRKYGISQDNLDTKELINVRNEKGKTPLHIAVKKSCVTLVKKLLNSGADVGSKDDAGQTPLHIAIKGNLKQVVTLLLDAGAGVNEENAKGVCPLHCALAKRNLSIMKALLDRGADIESRNSSNTTALDIAFIKGFKPEVDLLMEREAKVNLSRPLADHPLFVLDCVIEMKNLELFKILLDSGADMEAEGNDGIPFFMLLSGEFLPAVQFALERGVNVNMKNREGKTPLHHFQWSWDKNYALFVMLLENGADIEAKDNTGQTPLFIVVEDNWMAALELLLEKGANVKAKDKEGRTPLHFAKTGEVVDKLLESGADIEAKDNYGQTPSHLLNGHAFNRLLERGANVDSKDSNGITPLQVFLREFAITTIITDINKMLVAKDFEGKTPLQKAIWMGLTSVVNHLLEKGADVHIRDKYGVTPLHEAADITNQEAAVEIVKKLVKKGAPINAQNEVGETPLHVAVKCSKPEVIETLLVRGAAMNIVNNNGRTPLQLEIRDDASIAQLTQHIIKVKTANLEHIFTCLDSIQDSHFDIFKGFCLEELDRMKALKFGSTSLLHVFSEYKDPAYVLNNAIEEMIVSPDLKYQFPIYTSILSEIFDKAKHRHSLLDVVEFNVFVMSENMIKEILLPNEIKRKILSELTEKDIASVIEANKQVRTVQVNNEHIM